MNVEKKQMMDEQMIAEIEKDLRFISGYIKRKGREILNNYTITPPQFVALQWLYELGDLTIGELSNKMYLAFSTTTDLVDRLEKNNLVKRFRDEKDRRVVRVHLLEEGVQIIDEVIKKRQLDLAKLLEKFTEDEVRILNQYLKKLHDSMKD